MVFWLGMASGAAKEGTNNFRRIEEKIDRQLDESKKYASLASKRKQEADAVLNRIRTASQTYGVSESLLYGAYTDGRLDQVLGLYDEVQQKNRGNLTPQMLESLYTVPADWAKTQENANYEEELYKAYGVIREGVRREPEVTDTSMSRILLRMMGGDSANVVDEALMGETVGGYNAYDLQNLPEPELPQGAGGGVNYDVLGGLLDDIDERNDDSRDVPGVISADAQRTAASVAADAISQVGNIGRTTGAGLQKLQEILADTITNDIAIRVQQSIDSKQPVDLSFFRSPEYASQWAKVREDGLIEVKMPDGWYIVDGTTGDIKERVPTEDPATPAETPTTATPAPARKPPIVEDGVTYEYETTDARGRDIYVDPKTGKRFVDTESGQ